MNWMRDDLIDPDVMHEEIEYLFSVLENAWSYAEWNRERIGLDLQVLRNGYLGRLRRPRTLIDYVDTLRLLAAELQDGHINVKPPPGCRTVGKAIPASFHFFGNQVYLHTVFRRDRWDPLPEPGDQVVSINGEPISSVLWQVATRTSASTRRHLRSRVAHSLVVPSDGMNDVSEATIVCEKPDGIRISSRVELGGEVEHVPRPIALEWVNKSVARVSLPSFVPAHWFPAEQNTQLLPGHDPRITQCIELIDRTFEEAVRAQTLILDLRGNGGGTDILGQHVAKHLLPDGFTYYHLVTRYSEIQARNQLMTMKQFAKSRPLPGMAPEHVEKLLALDVEAADLASFALPTSGWSRRHEHKPSFEEKVDPFPGTLILMIDGACFSAADNFVACIQDQRSDVLVLGSGTGGGSGAPIPAVLPHTNVTVSMCSMKVYRPTGGMIEGIGSEPEVVVTPTPRDLQVGRDPVVEAALAFSG